jgi:hypothetical protein
MVKIAICYWGMTRSTKYVYKSHINHLFNIFKNENIDYDIFMHTWETDFEGQLIGLNHYDYTVDYEEYKLLNPTFYKIEKQCDFLNTINFKNYFNEKLYEQYGDSEYEWIPQLIRNHLCALESQKRVYNMVIESNNCYDYILYIRPDVEILNPIDINWINTDFDIILPNYHHYEGLNDRFAIIPTHKAVKYSTRIDEIIDFRRKRGRIVSEKYVKYIVDNYYPNIKFIDFVMTIIRPDGNI